MLSGSETQSRYEKKIEFAYYLAFICQGLTGSIFGPSMVWFANRTNSSVAEITPVLVFYNIGFIISSLVISRAFDRRPGNRLMGAAVAVLSAALAGLCLVRSRWTYFLLAFVIGTVLSVIDNGPNILFPWLLGERAKRPLNMVHLFYSVGCIITPFLIGVSLKRWNEAFPVFALLAFVIIFPALFLFRLPSPAIRSDGPSGSSGSAAGSASLQLIGAAGLFGLFMFLFSSSQSTVNHWISTVLVKNGLADESFAAMLASVFWVGTFTGRLLAAYLVEKLSPAKIVFICLAVAAADGTVMLFARGMLPLIAICMFMNGFATGPVLANAFSIMKSRGFISAKMNGIVTACGQCGGLLLPSLFGKFYGDSSSSYIPFVLIILCASLLELLVLHFILKDRTGPAGA